MYFKFIQNDLSCFRYWRQGQPDNWGDEPGEDCGQVVGPDFGKWNDDNCNAKNKYICKHFNGKSSEILGY